MKKQDKDKQRIPQRVGRGLTWPFLHPHWALLTSSLGPSCIPPEAMSPARHLYLEAKSSPSRRFRRHEQTTTHKGKEKPVTAFILPSLPIFQHHAMTMNHKTSPMKSYKSRHGIFSPSPRQLPVGPIKSPSHPVSVRLRPSFAHPWPACFVYLSLSSFVRHHRRPGSFDGAALGAAHCAHGSHAVAIIQEDAARHVHVALGGTIHHAHSLCATHAASFCFPIYQLCCSHFTPVHGP